MTTKEQALVQSALEVFVSGLYLMTAGFDGKRGGMFVNYVQRCGTDPAMICVAAPKGHAIDTLIRDQRNSARGRPGSVRCDRDTDARDGVAADHTMQALVRLRGCSAC